MIVCDSHIRSVFFFKQCLLLRQKFVHMCTVVMPPHYFLLWKSPCDSGWNSINSTLNIRSYECVWIFMIHFLIIITVHFIYGVLFQMLKDALHKKKVRFWRWKLPLWTLLWCFHIYVFIIIFNTLKGSFTNLSQSKRLSLNSQLFIPS